MSDGNCSSINLCGHDLGWSCWLLLVTSLAQSGSEGSVKLLRYLINSNIIKLKSLFVCLNALISETTGSNSENLFALDSPFIEEGYITSRCDQ